MPTQVQVPVTPTLQDELEIRYMGVTEVGEAAIYFFHDLRTNTNFSTADLERVDLALAFHRAAFYLGK